MKELKEQLEFLKKHAELHLSFARATNNTEEIAFYRGEVQGLEIALSFTETQMKREEAR